MCAVWEEEQRQGNISGCWITWRSGIGTWKDVCFRSCNL